MAKNTFLTQIPSTNSTGKNRIIYNIALANNQCPHYVNNTQTLMTTLTKGICYQITYLSDGRVGWSISPKVWKILKANARFNIFLVNEQKDEVFWVVESNQSFINLVDNKLVNKGRIRIDRKDVLNYLVNYEDIDYEFAKL